MTADELVIVGGHLIHRHFDDDAVELVQTDLVPVQAKVFGLDFELARLVTPGPDSTWVRFCMSATSLPRPHTTDLGGCSPVVVRGLPSLD